MFRFKGSCRLDRAFLLLDACVMHIIRNQTFTQSRLVVNNGSVFNPHK